MHVVSSSVKMFSIFTSVFAIVLPVVVRGRHIDNRTSHSNHTVDTAGANCLHACLDECLGWRNSSFTSDDCLIPCAVYVEEYERLNNENSEPGMMVPKCNDTHASNTGHAHDSDKPGKVSIKMTRMTTTNITEVWWSHIPAAAAYRVEVWCRDGQNDSMFFEEETWLTWYAFRQYPEKCPLGNRARIAAQNSVGAGEFSEFSDRFEESVNATATPAFDDRRSFKMF